MAHDVFLSHSTKDKTIADAICAVLEGAAIRCWIAPRDVQPGRSFAGEINRAIQQSKAMVLVFSAHSNNSEQVLREVQLAVKSHLHIVQFRIEDVRLNDDLEYFLSTPHWLDAMEPPLENHLERLKTAIRALLDVPAEQSVGADRSASTAAERRDVIADSPRRQRASLWGKGQRPPGENRRRKFVVAGAMAALLLAGALAGWWFGFQQPRQEAEAKKKEASPTAAPVASRAQPWENSLGVKFVSVPGTQVLFSVWETRVKDFAQFIKESGYDMKNGEAAITVEPDGNGGHTWKQQAVTGRIHIFRRKRCRPTTIPWFA